MNIEQFVKDVLGQITRAVNKNNDDNVDYSIDRTKGVDFDIAVTTVHTDSSDNISSDAVIRVVGVDVCKNSVAQSSHEVISHIRFNVDIDQ